jgi:hypothetical protein
MAMTRLRGRRLASVVGESEEVQSGDVPAELAPLLPEARHRMQLILEPIAAGYEFLVRTPEGLE